MAARWLSVPDSVIELAAVLGAHGHGEVRVDRIPAHECDAKLLELAADAIAENWDNKPKAFYGAAHLAILRHYIVNAPADVAAPIKWGVARWLYRLGYGHPVVVDVTR